MVATATSVLVTIVEAVWLWVRTDVTSAEESRVQNQLSQLQASVSGSLVGAESPCAGMGLIPASWHREKLTSGGAKCGEDCQALRIKHRGKPSGSRMRTFYF